jgi:hypothetical protein
MVVQKDPPPPRSVEPKVPRDLETICLKCLEKDPDRRYASAKDQAEDLRRFVNRFAILARRAGPLVRAKKWVKRNPALTAAALVILAAVGVAGFFAWRAEAERQQRLADEQRREAEALVEKRQAAVERAADGPWEPRQALSVYGPSRLPLRLTPARRAGPGS